MNGEALLWEADPVLDDMGPWLRQQFTAQVEDEYREILAALEQANPDLAALSQRFQQASAIDYFQNPLGLRVRSLLLTRKEEGEL